MRGFSAADWDSIHLVAFDVDGTLYDQRALRLRMAVALVANAVSSGNLRTLGVLKHYRRLREELGDAEVDSFEPVLLERTAMATGSNQAEVQEAVGEWIERRPLRYLAACRYSGVAELFAACRRHGKVVGVISDYPAAAKLAAMELSADAVVCAPDADVGILKPHPRGLQRLIERASATPRTTLLIGDRVERDGLAAERAGARCLIRSSRLLADGWQSFARFEDPVFAPMLAAR